MQSVTGRNSIISNFTSRFFAQVDISPLIIFRIIFGLLLFYQVGSYITNGWVYEAYIRPPFTFTFIDFEFLQPLPGNGMYNYFGLMALFAVMISAGAFYRVATIGFTLLWTIAYLMQKATYNNHYYLILLLSFVMIFMPANRFFSVDALRNPSLKKYTCPQWVIWVFVAQVTIVYTYAALHKIYPDWLSGRFISIAFASKRYYPVLGHLYRNETFQMLITYGGLLFDLLVAPLLLWRRTRLIAFILSVIFHVFNSITFPIGIFPYLGIALNIFFFNPETIRRIFFRKKPMYAGSNYIYDDGSLKDRLILYGVTGYLFIQLILPLRPLFFRGNVNWTDEGHRMSWRMMLREKRGVVAYKVADASSGKVWRIDPEKMLTKEQSKRLAVCPDLIWQYAQHLKKDFAAKGFPNVKIYASGWASLNEHPRQPLVDSAIDLAKIKWERFEHSNWITDYKK